MTPTWTILRLMPSKMFMNQPKVTGMPHYCSESQSPLSLSPDSFLMMDALKLDQQFLWNLARETLEEEHLKGKHASSLLKDDGKPISPLSPLMSLYKPLCVEVGCGTGVLSSYLARLLAGSKIHERHKDKAKEGPNGNSDQQPVCDLKEEQGKRKPLENEEKIGYFVATDINPKAVDLATKTFDRNGVRGQVIETDLLRGLEEFLNSRVVKMRDSLESVDVTVTCICFAGRVAFQSTLCTN